MSNFAEYGLWFQERNVSWVEPVDVAHVAPHARGFAVTLSNGESFATAHVVIATGLSHFAHVPPVLAHLPPELSTHTAAIARFAAFKARDVAVIGAGQSALEAAALLHEAGARPQLLVRKNQIRWMSRISQSRSLWRRLRSPISGLGTGPKAWVLAHFPGLLHRTPAAWRTHFIKHYLPPEGAWWLRARVENRVPIHTGMTVVDARETGGRVALRVRATGDGQERQLVVDHLVPGTGYAIDVERLAFLHPTLRRAIGRVDGAPRLNATFESSVPGLRFIGPASQASFGPLFRFVAGADYAARVVSAQLASNASRAAARFIEAQVTSQTV